MNNKILLCEDDPEMSSLLTTQMAREGFDVIHLDSCEGIYAMTKKHRPCLVLMDLILPDSGGFAATVDLKARSETRDTRVIMMSGYQNLPKMAKIAHAEAYLFKPFNIKELMSLVKDVLQPEGQPV